MPTETYPRVAVTRAAFNGYESPAPRAWSHRAAGFILFDAWVDRWEIKHDQLPVYPMRTAEHYGINDGGYCKQWNRHLDLVLEQSYCVFLLCPVRDEQPNSRVGGWLPQYLDGGIYELQPDQYWFCPRRWHTVTI